MAQGYGDDSILCVSFELVELLFQSLISHHAVCMAKHFRLGHPPFIPRPSLGIRELEPRDGLYFMRELLARCPVAYPFFTEAKGVGLFPQAIVGGVCVLFSSTTKYHRIGLLSACTYWDNSRKLSGR